MQLDEVCAAFGDCITASAPRTPASIGVRWFVLFHAKRHPRDMGATKIGVFLTHLVIAGKVSASIRNSAKRALQFFIGRCLRLLSRG